MNDNARKYISDHNIIVKIMINVIVLLLLLIISLLILQIFYSY